MSECCGRSDLAKLQQRHKNKLLVSSYHDGTDCNSGCGQTLRRKAIRVYNTWLACCHGYIPPLGTAKLSSTCADKHRPFLHSSRTRVHSEHQTVPPAQVTSTGQHIHHGVMRYLCEQLSVLLIQEREGRLEAFGHQAQLKRRTVITTCTHTHSPRRTPAAGQHVGQ